MKEVDEEQFEILMRTIDKFELMLKARMDEVMELYNYFRLANMEIELHEKRLQALEAALKLKRYI